MSIKQYNCPKCNKTFNKQGYLKNHLNQAYPCNEPIICKKCGDEFKTVQSLNKHLRRKTNCMKIKTNDSYSTPIITESNKDNKCYICGKTYSTKSNLKRHRKTCNIQDKGPDIIQLLMNQQKQIDFLQNQLITNQINPLNVTINNNNNTINIQQNTYVNITICSFGDEDLTKLDKKKIMELLKGQIEDFMPKMIEHVHANPDHPDFHNVFYDPKNEKAIIFAPISKTEMSWQMTDIRDVSKNLAAKIREHIRPGSGPYFDMAMKERDTETSNNIIKIADHIDWTTDDMIETFKEPLMKITKNEEFMKMVEIVE